MKRITIISILLLLSSFVFAGIFTIGEGTTVQGYLPNYGLYEYGQSRILYTATELSEGGLDEASELIAIGFNVGNSPQNYIMQNQRIYLRHSSLPDISTATVVSTSLYNLVFEGTVVYQGSGWYYVLFDTPFQYNGTNGLEILWENHSGNSGQGFPTHNSTAISNMASFKYQSGTFPNVGDAAIMSANRPHLRLLSPLSGIPEPATLLSPEDGRQIMPANVKLSWAFTDGFPQGYKLYFGTDEEPAFYADLGLAHFQTFTNLEPESTYYWKVVPYNSFGEASDCPVWSFETYPAGVVEIGTGTATQRYPWGHQMGYERSASIYTYDEIGILGVLDHLSWNFASTSSHSLPYKIYVGTTEAESFTAGTFANLVAELTLVKEGNFLPSATGWQTIQLDTPFSYSEGNLIVAVETNFGGTGATGSSMVRYSNSRQNSHAYWQANNNFPSGNSVRNANRPNILLGFDAFDTDPQLSISPSAIDFGNLSFGQISAPRYINMANSGGGTVYLNETDFSFSDNDAGIISYDSSLFPIEIGFAQIVNFPLYATGTSEGPFSVTLDISYSGQIHSVQLSGIILPAGQVRIGDGTINAGLPVNPYYNYSYSQSIYLQSEINISEQRIEEIAFYWNGEGTGTNSKDWVIYMGHTPLNSLSNWIPRSQLLQVFDGVVLAPASPGWVNIILDVPFIYNNVDNLVIAVDENTPTFDGWLQFYHSSLGSPNRSLLYYSDSINPDPAAPPTPTALPNFPNIRMQFGDLPTEPIINIGATSLDFGDISYDTLVGPLFIPVENVGVGNLNLNLADVSLSGADASMFSFDAGVFPINLSWMQRVNIPVYVQGTREGNISAQISISYEGETFVIPLSAAVLPQFLVTIGDGSADFKLPINPYYGYSYTQSIYLQSEINVPNKRIERIAYHWNGAGTGSNSKNWTIWMGHTPQSTLSTWVPITQLTQVFSGDVLATNVPGWIYINLDIPFNYNNIDNLIIAVDENTNGYDGNSQFYYNTATNGPRSLRYHSDSINPDPANPPNPNLINGIANIKLALYEIPTQPELSFQPRNLDFGYVSYDIIEGPINLSLTNRGLGTLVLNASDFSLSGPQAEMFSFTTTGFPLSLGANQSASVPFFVQSNLVGENQATLSITYGGEVYEIPVFANVIEPGLHLVQLPQGTETNAALGGPTPYGTYYKAFREQYLVLSSEIFAAGAIPGLIHSIGFNVYDVLNCQAMPNYRIRIKNTQQTSLNTTFEPGEYTLVWQRNSYQPTNGWNFHHLDTPFQWNGVDNILIEVVTDVFQSGYSNNAMVLNSSTPFESTLRFQSDSVNGDAGSSGSTYSTRPNLRFFFEYQEMGSISGTVTEDGFPLAGVLISIDNSIFSTYTNINGNYQLPYVNVGPQTITATKYGYPPLSHDIMVIEGQNITQNFAMTGIPEFAITPDSYNFGEVQLGGIRYKEFTISNPGGGQLTITSITHSGSPFNLHDLPTLPISIRNEGTVSFRASFMPSVEGNASGTITITDNQNNRYQIYSRLEAPLSSTQRDDATRQTHSITLSGYGVNYITIGEGTEDARYPLDYYYNSSLYQVIYTQEELNNFVGFIDGIKLYNSFPGAVNQTRIKIWMSNTVLNDLSGGWLSSSQMTPVFDGTVNFPAGQNAVQIDFPEPFLRLPVGNLVLLFQRPLTNYFGSNYYFKCDNDGEGSRARYAMSDTVEYDPAAMTDGTITTVYPKITFVINPTGLSHIQGVVKNAAGTPLQGVSVTLGSRLTITTNQQGEFGFSHLLPGDYQLSLSFYGYQNQTLPISLEEDDTLELELILPEIPKVSVSGRILASDTGLGISGADISFIGYANYSAGTDESGYFQLLSAVYSDRDYQYTISAQGYTTINGNITVQTEDVDMGEIVLNELAFAPTQVLATVSIDQMAANISWNPPDPNAFEINESFEGELFPPDGWSQLITNTGGANPQGARPTFSRFGTTYSVSPTDGSYQSGLLWVAEHQNEWLYTPLFTCPPDGYLKFDTHLQYGSDGGDHYYVKVSVNNGASWTVLWDGAALPSLLNNYDTPVVIDLSQYSGQQIKLAWHADDGADALGLWHNWFIDNIYIGNFVRQPALSFATKDAQSSTEQAISLKGEARAGSRALLGYRVWRLRSGQEDSENNWVELTSSVQQDTGILDDSWHNLPSGDYIWAVRAIYQAGVNSLPAFSNVLTKAGVHGNISGFVRRADNNLAIAGAVITAGEGYEARTTASGFYNLSVPAGSYTVTASHSEYHSLTEEDVVVVPEEAATLNFNMIPTSNEDVVEITVTKLNNNYPNPFNPETTISYDIKEPANVRLDIYNMKGQLVRTLVNEAQSSGRYRVVFDAKDGKGNALSSGIYLYRLRAGDYLATKKMMLLE